MAKRSKNRKKTVTVGRVDYRSLLAARSAVFADKRNKRARTRGDALRRAVERDA